MLNAPPHLTLYLQTVMSNDIQKADQIAYHIFTKLVLVVNQARVTAEPKSQAKVDKWVRRSLIELVGFGYPNVI